MQFLYLFLELSTSKMAKALLLAEVSWIILTTAVNTSASFTARMNHSSLNPIFYAKRRRCRHIATERRFWCGDCSRNSIQTIRRVCFLLISSYTLPTEYATQPHCNRPDTRRTPVTTTDTEPAFIDHWINCLVKWRLAHQVTISKTAVGLGAVRAIKVYGFNCGCPRFNSVYCRTSNREERTERSMTKSEQFGKQWKSS